MTHPNHQTNGASLEDCHTNFFALTDLCGIKWRKLVHGETGFAREPSDDPVLSSFSRCLDADILCVWRRVAATVPPTTDINGGLFDNIPIQTTPVKHPPLSLHAAKELWIFWYGEEPDLSGIVSAELLVGEGQQGSWETGLTYECRSLLFKALHNLIERCLLSRDCVRLGKFFVQPHDGHEKILGKNTYLSFSFAFFVHGESTVCASVDVREHPPVYSLTRQHLAAAQASTAGTPVILAPNGLAGNLTGVAYKSSDSVTTRFLEEWKKFYPVPNKYLGRDADPGLPPPVVEILVGGVKMKYPSCYVLVTDMDDPANPMPPTSCLLGKASPTETSNKLSSGPASPSCLPCLNKKRPNSVGPPALLSDYHAVTSAYHIASMQNNPSPAVRLPEWVWQDSILSPLEIRKDNKGAQPQLGHWDYIDPFRKVNCCCINSRCRKGQNWKAGSGGSNSGNVKNDQKTPRRIPFHRRPDDGFEPPVPRSSPGSGGSCPPPSYTRGQSSKSKSLPMLHGPSDSLPLPSPASAPSPLPNSHSLAPGAQHLDPTMPTLSPHPPINPSLTSHPPTPLEAHDKNTPAPTPDTHNPKSSANHVFSPYPNSIHLAAPNNSTSNVSSNNNSSNHGINNNNNNNNNNNSSSSSNNNNNNNTNNMNNNNNNNNSSNNNNNNNNNSNNNSNSNNNNNNNNNNTNSTGTNSNNSNSNNDSNDKNAPPLTNNVQSNAVNVFPILKRPVLAWKMYENCLVEDDQPSEFLYDYSTLDAWLSHPVKKFKPDAKESRKRNYLGDLYSTHQPNRAPTPPPQTMKMHVKQEANLLGPDVPESYQQKGTATGVKRSDPYEFDDDMAAPNVSMEGFKRTNVKDEDGRKFDGANGPSKCTSGNLFTSEGLTASYSDLDQIFDNSDDTSSDEPVQVPTPPNSNKPAGFMEENCQTILVKPPRGSGGATHAGILRPEELCKMFPTPPSMEHNPIASPSGHLSDGQINELIDGPINPRLKQEIYPNMGSPQEEPIEDWSYVFRPPLMFKMVGSSKYAPLTNLPSQNLPPVSLPPNCVYKPSWLQPSEKTNPPPPPPAPAQSAPVPPPAPAPAPAPAPPQTQAPAPTPTRPASSIMPPHAPRAGLSPISPVPHFPPSPMMSNMFRGPGSVGGGVRTPCPPPPPYEMPSPANSTASSYLNKNINSVEPVSTPVVARAPEANALVVNILLSDTGFNIFRDHNFDSCTLCVCNAGPKCVGNIRGADASYYLQQQQSHSSVPPPPNSPYSSSLVMNGPPPPPYGMMPNPGSPTHNSHSHHEEDSIRCTCGFSAVVNRRLSHKSGLFYEDELEITGLAEDPSEKRKSSLLSYLSSMNKENINVDSSVSESLDIIPQNILEILREQFVVIQSSSNSLHRAARLYRNVSSVIPYPTTVNVLEFTDCNEVTNLALEQGRLAVETSTALCKTEDSHMRHSKVPCMPSVHRWPFLRARGPQCNQDIVRVMKNLQPILQEAIQKKCTTRLWDAPYTVSGPLTWRQFHRLAGRGTDDRCEPQPIPSLLVGYEKDWLSLSPYALHFWDKLLLEPYSYSRDVAYIVVTPENDFVLQKVRAFFKELSSTYEVCRLGRHSPITKVLRDGILRVGKAAATKLAKEPVDEWFTNLGENSVSNLLKLYAQACKYHLAPHLSQITVDKGLLDPPEASHNRSERSAGSSATAESSDRSHSNFMFDFETESLTIGGSAHGSGDYSHDEEDADPPTVVIYLVEPFTMGSDSLDLQRLALLALLRCFTTVLSSVPDNIRSNICVQIISLESIVELGKARETIRHNDHMRSLALSVFSQCRKLLVHTSNVKSLTGFGTAALADLFLKSKDEKNRAPYRLYSPPYILAPHKERVESTESFGKSNPQHCSVLYVSYCLSEDQRMLLTVATDDTGSIFESQTINIEIPNRSRRKKASARRIGLQKLMDFILGIISQSVQPWRLVVGRIGRIGHGELKGWSWLLSRKSLLKASKHLREICNQCSLLSPTDVPCILSACLVSLEPDSALRLMPDQFTPDERFSQTSVNCQLSTPQDVTCTHILVFPTSATSQSSQTAFNEQHINGPDLGDDDIFSALNDDDVAEGIDGMQDLNDIFSTWPDACPGGVQSPTGSPRRNDSMSQQGSPSCNMENMDQQGSYPCNVPSRNGGSGEIQEEVGTLLQQPLALGYFVSTAPTGPMPSWFWASCPHLEDVCPAFLKNALHMHSPAIQQNSDDLLQQQSAVTVHPLDSQYTTDVLRYVLEGYNALSWLALDSNTRDRLSCLPVHVQVLMQLYHMTSTLV